jgi:hypothetical protein
MNRLILEHGLAYIDLRQGRNGVESALSVGRLNPSGSMALSNKEHFNLPNGVIVWTYVIVLS